jgi:hypothetical protein
MPDEDEGFGEDAGREQATSVASLAERIARVEEAIKGLAGGAHHAAAEHTAERLDRPAAITAEVRKELERARKQEKEQGEQDQLREKVANLEKLTEKTPDPPQRRVEQLMGWH